MKPAKFILVVLLLAFGRPLKMEAQLAPVPDPAFRAYLQTNFPTIMSGPDLIIAQAATVSFISCPGLGIADLSGIEHFVNLTALQCYNNALPNLPDMSLFPDLATLWTFNNPLAPTTLDLSANTKIYDLRCYANNLTGLVFPSSLPDLWLLNCSSNDLTDLSTLGPAPNLEQLYCEGNSLTALPDLSSSVLLRILHCYSNNLIALPNFSTNVNLEVLLTSINPLLPSTLDLSANAKLQILRCSSNNLTNLLFASSLPDLREVNCSNNSLTDLSTLGPVPGLESFSCYNNEITTLPDLSTALPLSLLSCYNNALSTLPDLSSNVNLELLWCMDNPLTTSLLDLSANSKLQDLRCYANNLTGLIFPPSLPDLWILHCSSNDLPDLSTLPAAPALLRLYCEYNLITALPDLSGSPLLETIWCQQNQICQLPDLSANLNLTSVKVNANRLDFRSAATLRQVDQLPSLAVFDYAPQLPFCVIEELTACPSEELEIPLSEQDSATSYQWFKDGVLLPGETGPALVLDPFSPADTGNYAVQVFGDALSFPGNMNFGPGISAFQSADMVVREESPETCGLVSIPALSEWGLIILGLLVLCLGVISIRRRQLKTHLTPS